jgi:preprotein translocase subunit SecA
LLSGEDPEAEIHRIIEEYADYIVEEFASAPGSDNWDWDTINSKLARNLFVNLNYSREEKLHLTADELCERIIGYSKRNLEFKKAELIPEIVEYLFRFVPLRVIDERWKDHLYDMDRIKEGVGLRAYGQRDPLIEYKKESFQMFMELLDNINEETLRGIFHAQMRVRQPERREIPSRLSLVHQEATNLGFGGSQMTQERASAALGMDAPRPLAPMAGKPQPVKVMPKVGRNEPCPCGSGKKYKLCHGRV